jgi:hypothetical protein
VPNFPNIPNISGRFLPRCASVNSPSLNSNQVPDDDIPLPALPVSLRRPCSLSAWQLIVRLIIRCTLHCLKPRPVRPPLRTRLPPRRPLPCPRGRRARRSTRKRIRPRCAWSARPRPPSTVSPVRIPRPSRRSRAILCARTTSSTTRRLSISSCR